eukprot:9104929-Alexandrium_andersonii.AAC.1
MSASLVGSGVYKRQARHSARWPHGPGVPCNKVIREATFAACPCLWAVSYTHLTLPTICSV